MLPKLLQAPKAGEALVSGEEEGQGRRVRDQLGVERALGSVGDASRSCVGNATLQ